MARRSLLRAVQRTIAGTIILEALSFGVVFVLAQTRSAGRPKPAATESTALGALQKRAAQARDAGHLDEAATLYRRALVLAPRWTEGWWSLGTLQYDSDRYAEAELSFRKVVALDPKHGTARAMLGLCEFEMGEFDRSLKDIEVSKRLGVLEDSQLRQVVTYHEGVLLQRAGQFEAAKAALASLCRDGLRSNDLAAALGMIALRMRGPIVPDRNSEAGQVVLHVGRAACLTGAKDYDAARSEYEQVIARAPHFPLLHYAYGCGLIDARDVPGAVSQFEQEIADQPKSVLPRLRIAVAQYKVNSAAGLKYAEEAVKLEPQLPLGHYLLGLLLLDTGAYERAVPELEIARKAFPNEARIDLSLGTAYAHVGRSRDAALARADFVRKKQVEQAAAQGELDISRAMDARTEQ